MHPACRSASRASGFQFFCRGYKNLGGEHHLSANLGDSRSGTDPLQITTSSRVGRRSSARTSLLKAFPFGKRIESAGTTPTSAQIHEKISKTCASIFRKSWNVKSIESLTQAT